MFSLLAGNLEAVLPTGRRIAGSVSRDLRLRADKPKGTVEFKLTDTLPSKQQRSATFNAKMSNVDFEAGFFDVTAQCKYSDFSGKELAVECGAKNAKKGQNSAGGVSLKVDGTMIESPFNVNVNLDEYSSSHAIFKVTGLYASKYSIDMKGKYYVGSAKRPHTHEMTATVSLPDTQLQKVVFASSGRVKEAKTDADAVEIEYNGSLEYAQHRVALQTTIKGSKHEGKGSITVEVPGRDKIEASGNYKYAHDKATDTCQCQGAVDIQYQAGKRFHADGKMSYAENRALTMDANIETDLENAKKITVQYAMRRENEVLYVTEAVLTADGRTYRLDTKVSNSNGKRRR